MRLRYEAPITHRSICQGRRKEADIYGILCELTMGKGKTVPVVIMSLAPHGRLSLTPSPPPSASTNRLPDSFLEIEAQGRGFEFRRKFFPLPMLLRHFPMQADNFEKCLRRECKIVSTKERQPRGIKARRK